MAKKKLSTAAPQKDAQLPVLHGDCFRAFLEEAHSIGNEVVARRAFCSDVVEYLTQKGLIDEWGDWLKAKRSPKS